MSVAKRVGLRLLAGLALSLLIAIAVLFFVLRGSLPKLDGALAVAVSSSVHIDRDALGIPTLRASSRHDLMFAQGFVHAQERFFQMDLSRRLAAGRLAELFGTRALAADKSARVHGLALVADAALENMSPRHRAQLSAYVAGVNAGMAQLRSRPFEYWLLRTHAEAWTERDSLLVLLSMFMQLNDQEAQLDRQRGLMFEAFSSDVYQWLTAPGSSWDAPLGGPEVALPPIPAKRWFDDVPPPATPDTVDDDTIGSNSFAIAGDLTSHGGAMLANDMHLALSLPNTWYRVRLLETRGSDTIMEAVGASLPGVPGVVVGSNTFVAWGFTNSYGDYSDRVVLRTSGSPGRYRVPRGGDTLRVREEVIGVRDAESVTLSVPMTRFGPVVAEDAQRRPVVVRWLAHFAEAVNLNLLDMLDVTEVDSAVALAQRLGIPPQNILVAGRDGRVAWTIAGRLPRRSGYDPSRPNMSDQDGGWRGWLPAAQYPALVDPPTGRLWTANGRVAELNSAPLIGLGDYSLGARAQQIRDLLFAREQFTESDLLDVALDTRGVFLERWRVLMRSVLSAEAVAERESRRVQLSLLSQGRLAAREDSVTYRLVRDFRARVEQDVFGSFLAPLAALPDIRIDRLRQREGPLWQTASKQPAHLLPPGHVDWDAYLLDVLDRLGADSLNDNDWGERNTLKMTHPMAGALPGFLRGWLQMPATPLPGDAWMPRVQSPSFGASQRMVVAPGHEADGIFHMPGGQSGHPLSPFYKSGHTDWAQGNASALLPGATRYTLTLNAANEN